MQAQTSVTGSIQACVHKSVKKVGMSILRFPSGFSLGLHSDTIICCKGFGSLCKHGR